MESPILLEICSNTDNNTCHTFPKWSLATYTLSGAPKGQALQKTNSVEREGSACPAWAWLVPLAFTSSLSVNWLQPQGPHSHVSRLYRDPGALPSEGCQYMTSVLLGSRGCSRQDDPRLCLQQHPQQCEGEQRNKNEMHVLVPVPSNCRVARMTSFSRWTWA